MYFFTVNKYLLSLFVLFITSLSFGNTDNETKIKELQNQLRSAKTDTLKVTIYNKLAFEFIATDTSQARIHISKALSISEKIGFKKGLAQSHINIGKLEFSKRAYKKAFESYYNALLYAQDIEKQELIAKAYFEMGESKYMRDELKEAIDYYFKALEIEEKLQNNNAIAIINTMIGDTYGYMREYEMSEKYLLIGKDLLEEVGDKAFLVKANYKCAKLYRSYAKYDQALIYYLDCIKYCKEVGNLTYERKCLSKMGSVYRKFGNYNLSIKNYLASYNISERQDDKINMANELNNIGVVFYEQKDYTNALDYYEKSLSLYEKLNQKGTVPLIYNNIGLVYFHLNKYDSAVIHFQTCIDKAIPMNFPRAIGWGYYGLFQALESKQEFSQAKVNLLKSIEIREKLGRNELLAQSYNSMGTVLLREKKFRKAINYYQKSAEICREIGNPLNYKDALEGLSLSYEQLGFYQKSLVNHKLFKSLSDSLINKENTKKLTQQTMQFDFDKEKDLIQAKNEKEMLFKQNQLERQKYFTYAFVAGFLIVIAFALVVYRNFRQKQRVNKLLEEKNFEITEQKEEITNQAEELKASNEKLELLSQFKENLTSMIVHDLKNPINAIIGLSRNPSTEENKLNTINNSGKKMMNLVLNILDVQKFEETKFKLLFTNNLLSELIEKGTEEIEFLCQEKNIQIEYEITEDFSLTIDFEIVLRVLVNILSNAIKYSDFNSTIYIKSGKKNDSFISITIRDEGRGIPADQVPYVFDKFWQFKSKKSSGVRSVGLGLTFCKMAVEAHGGKISASSVEGEWTEFYFTVPFEKEMEVEGRKVMDVTMKSKSVDYLNLSSQEQNYLKDFAKEMSIYQSYETTDILNVLYGIEKNDPMISKWKDEVENSVVTGNVDRLEGLLMMVND